MKNSKIKTIIIGIATLLFTTGCEDDNSTGPTTHDDATMSGTITFIGDWPADGDIAVSLSSNWPPTGMPAAFIAITSSELSSGTYDYTFEDVTFGTYASIAVSWQDPGDSNPATNQHTLGAYGGVYPFFSAHGGTDPTVITVSETEYELTGLDFNADFSYTSVQEQ